MERAKDHSWYKVIDFDPLSNTCKYIFDPEYFLSWYITQKEKKKKKSPNKQKNPHM